MLLLLTVERERTRAAGEGKALVRGAEQLRGAAGEEDEAERPSGRLVLPPLPGAPKGFSPPL